MFFKDPIFYPFFHFVLRRVPCIVGDFLNSVFTFDNQHLIFRSIYFGRKYAVLMLTNVWLGPHQGLPVFLFKWKGVSYSEYLTGSWLPYSSYGNYYRTYSGKSAHTQNVQGLMSTQTLVHHSNRRQWWTMELVIHLLALFNVFEYEALVEKYCLWPI